MFSNVFDTLTTVYPGIDQIVCTISQKFSKTKLPQRSNITSAVEKNYWCNQESRNQWKLVRQEEENKTLTSMRAFHRKGGQ